MIYFTTEKSAGYGARIFIQNDISSIDASLHNLAKELSVWKGADKSMTILEQDCSEAWAKTGKANFHGHISRNVKLVGYEMDAEELAVMKKRCKGRGGIDVTPILKDLKQEWQ